MDVCVTSVTVKASMWHLMTDGHGNPKPGSGDLSDSKQKRLRTIDNVHRLNSVFYHTEWSMSLKQWTLPAGGHMFCFVVEERPQATSPGLA